MLSAPGKASLFVLSLLVSPSLLPADFFAAPGEAKKFDFDEWKQSYIDQGPRNYRLRDDSLGDFAVVIAEPPSHTENYQYMRRTMEYLRELRENPNAAKPDPPPVFRLLWGVTDEGVLVVRGEDGYTAVSPEEDVLGMAIFLCDRIKEARAACAEPYPSPIHADVTCVNSYYEENFFSTCFANGEFEVEFSGEDHPYESLITSEHAAFWSAFLQLYTLVQDPMIEDEIETSGVRIEPVNLTLVLVEESAE